MINFCGYCLEFFTKFPKVSLTRVVSQVGHFGLGSGLKLSKNFGLNSGLSSSVRRIFERGGARKFSKFENNKDQNENFPPRNQVRFPAQT